MSEGFHDWREDNMKDRRKGWNFIFAMMLGSLIGTAVTMYTGVNQEIAKAWGRYYYYKYGCHLDNI